MNPKAIPGADVDYTLVVENSGTVGQSDADSVVIVDPIAAGGRFFVGNLAGAGPIEVVDGAGSAASGLSYTFASLGSAADDVDFSTDGNNFNYTPVPDIDGYDGNVSHIRITPKGTLKSAPAAGTARFALRFRVRVRQDVHAGIASLAWHAKHIRTPTAICSCFFAED